MTMPPRPARAPYPVSLLPVSLLLAPLLLTACGDGSEPQTTDGRVPPGQREPALPSVPTVPPYEFETWYADFPYRLHLPPKVLGQWYGRRSQQALARVVANLEGTCTREAWTMAKEFFDRHEERAAPLLIEALDAALQDKMSSDHALGILDAMGRSTSGVFAGAITRAATHDHIGIRRAAFRALIVGGDEDAVLKLRTRFNLLDRLEANDWIKAAARHLSDEHLFPTLRDMLTRTEFAAHQAAAFESAMQLPPERGVRLFDPIWDQFPEDLQLHIAGILHAAGDARGTIRLRHALRPPVELVQRQMVALQGTLRGDPTPMKDELLLLTLEDNKELDMMLVQCLGRIKEDTTTDALRMMTDPRNGYEVRQLALRELAARGETTELEQLVEQVREAARGGAFKQAIADLVGANYGNGVPALVERMKKSARAEEVFYLRMIARIDSPQSLAALTEVFQREEYVYENAQEDHSNVTFLGVQMANLGGQAEGIIALLASLPETDYRRRAVVVHVLANAAGATEGKAWRAKAYDSMRKIVFDRSEVPQLRILCLDYLRKDIRIDDAMRLSAGLEEEKPPMRAYFNDYLHEFF